MARIAIAGAGYVGLSLATLLARQNEVTVVDVIPEKLDFLSKYELFAFGLALILIMRFRPEGIIPNRRRQLEFHEDEAQAPGNRPMGDDTVPATTAGA